MPEINEIQHPKKRAFLSAYVESGGNITKAVKAAKIDRSTHYVWLRDDPEYPALFEEAKLRAGDVLEAEATRRAVEGTLEPVFYQGQKVGAIRRYSDTLLIVRLKAVKPEEYRDRADVNVNGSIRHDHKVDLSVLSESEIAYLRTLADKLAPEQPAGG